MNWIVLAAALAAMLALGGFAAWLKLGRSEPIFTTSEAAMRAAEDAITGFVAVSAAVASDARAALVLGEGMRVVVLKAHGGQSAAREIVWRDVRATHEGMVVATKDRRFGTVLIAGVDNLDIRRLAPQLTRV